MAGLDLGGTGLPLPVIVIAVAVIIAGVAFFMYRRKNAGAKVADLPQKSVYTESEIPSASQQLGIGTKAANQNETVRKGPFSSYIKRNANKRSTLEMDLINAGVKKTPYDFVKTMMIYAAFVSVTVGICLVIFFVKLNLPLIGALVLGGAVGGASYMVVFQRFLTYPTQVTKSLGKNVERDILFAARDIVISMRSGMPLFNAITSVSSGYGETSKEFRKIIELVQLGMPIAQAIDEISDKSESKTFKRIMLQASVSIKSGVDVTNALQEVLDEITQERVIELRRYGQKLNALAMFYMLFGVIFPSMGIAVVTIMATFISIFPVTYLLLVVVVIFVAFIQLVLLNIMRSSRPNFTM